MDSDAQAVGGWKWAFSLCDSRFQLPYLVAIKAVGDASAKTNQVVIGVKDRVSRMISRAYTSSALPAH
jgi:hypothetical protein